MKTYRQTIENLQSPRSFKHFFILGIFYIILSIMFFYRDRDTNITSGIIYFITGIGFIAGYFFNKNRNQKLYIEFNNDGIETKLSTFSSLKIKWDEIKEVKIKPISVDFILKNNETKNISLGNLSYKSVLEIKEKLQQFIDNKKARFENQNELK